MNESWYSPGSAVRARVPSFRPPGVMGTTPEWQYSLVRVVSQARRNRPRYSRDPLAERCRPKVWRLPQPLFEAFYPVTVDGRSAPSSRISAALLSTADSNQHRLPPRKGRLELVLVVHRYRSGDSGSTVGYTDSRRVRHRVIAETNEIDEKLLPQRMQWRSGPESRLTSSTNVRSVKCWHVTSPSGWRTSLLPSRAGRLETGRSLAAASVLRAAPAVSRGTLMP